MYRVKKIHYIEDQEKVFANHLPEEFEESIKMYKEIREKAAAKTNEIYTGYVSTKSLVKFHLSFILSGPT